MTSYEAQEIIREFIEELGGGIVHRAGSRIDSYAESGWLTQDAGLVFTTPDGTNIHMTITARGGK